MSRQTSSKMKGALLLACVVTLGVAVPEKRFVLDTIAQEQQKFVNCDAKSTRQECDECCRTTDWSYHAEQIACLGTCLTITMSNPQKRFVLDTIAGEQQKFVNCDTKHTKPECDTCCKTTQWNYPGEEIGCLGTCYALPMTAGSQKRFVLDTIAQEQQKFVTCDTKHTKPECDTCCKTTQWNYPGEEIGCLGTCYALPMTAGSQKRFVLDTIAQEQQKFVSCDTKSTRQECDECCRTTDWSYHAEQIACLGTCFAIPMA